jgi:diguanylate cyclase
MAQPADAKNSGQSSTASLTVPVCTHFMGGSVEYSASLVILAVIVAVVELFAGVGIGWWLRGTPESPKQDSQEEVQRARNAVARLHELTERVAADVGEHSTRVQEISHELTQSAATGGELDSVVLGSVARIIEVNSKLQQQLKSAEVKLQEQAHQIEVHAADALTDALTGASNRRAFDVELNRRMQEWQRREIPFCLMMTDVDHFKKFNDTHGHLAGDEVLRGVARGLGDKLRDTDIVARYGGEEFAIIMAGTTLDESEIGAVRAAAHIADCRFEFEGRTLNVTVSGGLAQVLPSDDAAVLIKRADEALYAAKKAGRNRVCIHDGNATRPSTVAKVEPVVAAPVPAPVAAPTPKPAAKPETPAAEPAASGQDPFRTDVQTGLPNRTSLCEEVRRRVAESHRYDSPLSLMLVKVNAMERLGGRPGDPTEELVVRTVSQFLSAGMREMDLVARYYDDVFAVLLPGTPLSQAIGVAERLRVAVAGCPLRGKEFELRIAVATGLAEVLRSDDSAALLKRAEAALQGAVQSGREGTFFHTGREVEQFLATGTA